MCILYANKQRDIHDFTKNKHIIHERTRSYMSYSYKRDDIFYDVESLTNVFTVAWYFPHNDVNAIVLSYLDDDKIIQSDRDLDYIRSYIYNMYPKLQASNTQIVFEDISQTGCIREFANQTGFSALGLQSFAKRLGLTNERTFLNAHINDREIEAGGLSYNKAYYPVKQTDPDYDPDKHGYRFGYNSTNYDVTMLAYLLGSIHDKHFKPEYVNQPVYMFGEPLTARRLREYNDELFDDKWRGQMWRRLVHDEHGLADGFGDFTRPEWCIRQGWQLSGRYIDVSKLNEKLQKVGLKRLLGMLGLQIMESDKLSNNTTINTLEEMADLLAYNISDVINLRLLFEHKVYMNAFNIRGDLLKNYPQVIYGQKRTFGGDTSQAQADVGNYQNIRRDRLTQDSSSAKFVELALAPYAPIKDIPTVSFMYPSEQEAKRQGIPRVDVLEETKRYFEENITNDPTNQAHIDFMEIYNFYDNIRGHNYNQSEAYVHHYGDGTTLPANLVPKTNDYIKQLMDKYNTNLFYHYIDEEGNVKRSSCLANFSIGGIHGAEINMDAYNEDLRKNKIEKDVQTYVESLYPTATDALNGPVYITLPDHLEIPERLENKVREDRTVRIREFVKSGSTKKNATWRDVPDVQLFKKNASGKWDVNNKYTYVSVGPSHHEDFESYYPLLLSQLSVFVNPEYHGYKADGSPVDPYYDMYLERAEKKDLARNPNIPELQRELYDIEQNSKKLLINAASGAGDATFDNNIRANNAVISMRIIGQLFAWLIGQAQTLAGGRVPSTNTDGLYVMDLPAEINDRVLQETAKDMRVKISPERLDRFVTKDSNNRLEVAHGRIASASGGTLNSWKGPEPNQSLDHAAIIDHILAKYLADETITDPANTPFDETHARKLFDDFIKHHIQNGTPQVALRFFQWIVSSSTGTHRYNYLKRINKHTGEATIHNLQQYNRIFLIKDNHPNVRQELYLATRRVINKTTWSKRYKAYQDGEITHKDVWDHHPEALYILKQNGLDLLSHNQNTASPHYKDQASVQKVRTMPTNQHIAIYNHSIVDLPNAQAIAMIQELDINAYLSILKNTFRTWSNL